MTNAGILDGQSDGRKTYRIKGLQRGSLQLQASIDPTIWRLPKSGTLTESRLDVVGSVTQLLVSPVGPLTPSVGATFSILARANYYGEYSNSEGGLATIQEFSPEILFDFEFAYNFTDKTLVAIGARNAFEGVEGGYSQGRYTLLELLDAQSSLTDAAMRELDALVTFHTALATIEGLTGRPVTLIKGKSK